MTDRPGSPFGPFAAMAISDRRRLGSDLSSWLDTLAAVGVPAVQIREKDLPDQALFELCRMARSKLGPPVRVLVNGRPDLALAAGCDGVHLPGHGLPVAAVRRRWGSRLLIGVSTHAEDEVAEAGRSGADYVLFGPVYPTASKPGLLEFPGLNGLVRAAAHPIPVLALGGITRERLAEVADAGAAGFAAIGQFQRLSSDLAGVVREAELRFGDRNSSRTVSP